jgi:allophanate hydrolase
MAEVDLRDAAGIARACGEGRLAVRDVVVEVVGRLAASERPEAWISVLPTEHLLARARELDDPAARRRPRPLLGVPFAVKDNIDAAGLPTTAGCPAFAYAPAESATAVQCLVDAGAVLVGKTHMDQFATGLVGTRSPLGPCRNAYAADYIAGGSSSGSGVVTALGIVSFALGTDTAGSGRVPAALGGVVGLKPTRGLVSLTGVVPACLSLDCVSIFAPDCATAARVFDVLAGAPQDHPWCRAPRLQREAAARFRMGVPRPEQMGPLDAEAARLYAVGVEAVRRAGGEAVEIDYAPFLAAGELLYRGPWIAERQAAVGDFIEAHPGEVDPTVAAIVGRGREVSGRAVFEGAYALARLRRQAAAVWEQVDVLAVPTVPCVFRIAEVAESPIATNAQLGRHNDWVNLLDLSACVVPVGMRSDGVPAGLTLCAPAFCERLLLNVGAQVVESLPPLPPPAARGERVAFVVVGAHLSGMPLNAELVRAGGRLEGAVRTSADYRLYALAGTVPEKPGLVRTPSGGVPIEAEVWSLPHAAYGRLVVDIPPPLGMGRVALEDGRELPGFVCAALPAGAADISTHGGWKAYLSARP